MPMSDDPSGPQSVYDAFCRSALIWPERPFLKVLDETAAIYGISAGAITYATMLGQVERRRIAYREAGYGPGRRVGLLLENRPSFFEHWLALNALGVSVVPINPELRLAELSYLVAHAELALIVALPSRHDELQQAARDMAAPPGIIGADDPLPCPAGHAVPWQGPVARREAALLYTSGTTGLPKGCVLSNTYFLQSGAQYRRFGGLCEVSDDAEVMLTPLPLFHMNALAVSAVVMIVAGGCLVCLDRFHPRSWWESVVASGATIIHYLGVMPSILMTLPPTPHDTAHRIKFGFGAGVDALLHAPFEDRFGFPLIEAWGMTETGNSGAICAAHEPRHIGTNCFGRPGDDLDVNVVDEQMRTVPDDAPGELLVRHSGADPRFGFFDGYLKDTAATAEAWQDGWFHTGDIVRRASDGTLRFVDRKKNVIRRSGENIAAVEVEVTLNRHPAIQAAAVGAVPDPLRGDEVFAVVVRSESEVPAGTLAEDIVMWTLDQLAYYKSPGYIAFVDALPLTPTNKIRRGELKDLILQLHENKTATDLRHLKTRKAPA